MIESPETPLAGRRSVGTSFIEGLVRHAPSDELLCVAETKEHFAAFQELVRQYGWQGSVRGTLSRHPEKLEPIGSLMVPGPNLNAHSWVRRRSGQQTYSLCGVTHTLATPRIMQGLFDLLAAPIENWDAIICTSQAVKNLVTGQFDAAEAYYRQRFGAEHVTRPQLPVIPLGIHADRLVRRTDARKRWRQEYDIPPEATVVLTMGRLSVYEKMHPVPLFLALQKAAQETHRPVVLLMTGWFADEEAERQHRSAAEHFAPLVEVHFPDGRETDVRNGIWSAADIFALPVDNVQETFGLAPVEAMAAGLPVICSDWDGFKDTIEHGVSGYRIRTLMSRPGTGEPIARRLEQGTDTYLHYLGSLQQRTVVDVREMADAFAGLIDDPERRRRMGQTGQARARGLFDWASIIPQYYALWEDLAARRTHETSRMERQGPSPANPAAMDPFTLYRAYPTGTLEEDTSLQASRAINDEELHSLMDLTGATDLARLVTRPETVLQVHARIAAAKALSFAELLDELDAAPRSIEGAVLWLTKFDLVQVAAP